MRQIVLDTETTGLEPRDGHRIVEVGCVELVARRFTGNNFHIYINPDRKIDLGAIEVHGITNEFLADKDRFSDVAEKLHQYLKGAELIIHNAAFDVGFLDHEFSLLNAGIPPLSQWCSITDTLGMARELHPGQRNSLDALCQRYEVDNSNRDLHGALLDAELLAQVYLAMTGGQSVMELAATEHRNELGVVNTVAEVLKAGRPRLIVSDEEAQASHLARLEKVAQANDEGDKWRQLGW